MSNIFIGIMSGTSIDGVDAVAVDFSDNQIRCLGHYFQSFPKTLAKELNALCLPGDNEIVRAGQAAVQLSQVYAEAVAHLLKDLSLSSEQIQAIGCHGQTIRHHPELSPAFSYQLMNGSHLACLSQIPVICDFRAKDIAAHGEGAPLVPAFHHAVFAKEDVKRAVINIGGIANLTLLPGSDSDIIGYDTGPGNTLMDAWIKTGLGDNYDRDGQWAREGTCNQALLQSLLQDAYFAKLPPKSTGREYFTLSWLEKHRKEAAVSAVTPKDIQATLLFLTVSSIRDAVNQHDVEEIYLCGGGTYNSYLCGMLQEHLPHQRIHSTKTLGIPPEHVEAMAFAWLAKAYIDDIPGNIPSVTGAEQSVILGCMYK
ncbi:anhydro-N-acetylmuramic acid kinase [Algicola sagamiensis]|uniref:anhydro-N-acetylmuramic acid kinase n=1 Tax=Algicola sagamiensis TaxID=163869 RepID=UPI0003727804|nr:anhydro-N-acetylmuramic acid kinase [Algicola sagamiensis]